MSECVCEEHNYSLSSLAYIETRVNLPTKLKVIPQENSFFNKFIVLFNIHHLFTKCNLQKGNPGKNTLINAAMLHFVMI